MNEFEGMGDIPAKPNKPIIEPKYFSAEDVVKMLPLITAYCRDIEQVYAELIKLMELRNYIDKLTSLSREGRKNIDIERAELDDRIKMKIATVRRWIDELDKMNMKVCKLELGRINVPVFDLSTHSGLYICIHKSTTAANLEWHCLPDDHLACRPYWYGLYSSSRTSKSSPLSR